MLKSLLIKRQAGGLQPYLKKDFNAHFFPVNVEEFSKRLVKPIEHFIQHNKNACWTKCLIRLTECQNSKKRQNHVR